jgi:hypothetical protein
MNAIRVGRGPWRLAAAMDDSGLVCFQQFIGLWPKNPSTRDEMLKFVAILNGPVANSFLSIRSPQKGIRLNLTASGNCQI